LVRLAFGTQALKGDQVSERTDNGSASLAPQSLTLSRALIAIGILLAGASGFWAGAYRYKHGLWPVGPDSTFRAADSDEFATYDADRKWAQKLVGGGYILYIRHAQREKWNDVTAFDAVEILTGAKAEETSYKRAVCLTQQGVEESRAMGEVFRLANIRVGAIVTSSSCRARQTAMHAFGRIDRVSTAFLHRTAIMKEQHKAFAVEARRIVESLEPAPGANAVVVAHSGTMRFDGELLVDVNETGGKLDQRDETGFVVLEKTNGKIIARHKFWSIKNLAYAILELPISDVDLETAVRESAPAP
jgi:broad specificity phosphatase PhoE